MQNGSFELVGYDELYNKVVQISDLIESTVVTEDNIKENKKLVARVRKATDEINRERIDFKKAYLEPYENYALQVKKISEEAKRGEDAVRVQIRELEEQQREQKEEEIHELFDRRLRAYDHKEFMPFDDFMCPQYANKSYSMNKVEQEMVDFLESRDADYDALVVFSESSDATLEELIMEYLDDPQPDVSRVIKAHDRKTQAKERIRENIISDTRNKEEEIQEIIEEDNFLIGFKDSKDYYKALFTLKEAGIEFTITDIPVRR